MIIEIDGVGRVEVDPSFADLSPQEQQAVVDQIRSEARAERRQGEVPTQRIRAAMQGVTLGFADEIEAAARNPLSAIAGALGLGGENYSRTLEDIRGRLDAYREDRPLEAIGYEVGGAVLPTVGLGLLTGGTGGAATAAATSARLAPTLGRAAAIGATEGAIAGFGSGEGGLGERLESAAIGGTIGGVAAPVATVGAERLLRGGRSVMDTLGIGGDERALTVAERRMLQAMERDGMTPDEALARLQEAQGLGIEDITPADLGEAARRQGYRVQAIPNERNQPVVEQFAERRMSQAEQVAEGATRMAGVTGNTGIDFIDELDEATRLLAQPAYERAYRVVLPADPFRPFANRRVIQDAYRAAQDLADISGSGSMPPLDQLLRDGRMPTQVAHQVKIGLDRLIEAETDAVTGRVTMRGRELTRLRNDWNDTIKNLNPDYRAANAQYADRQRLMDAYRIGNDMSRMGEREMVRAVRNMTDAEREALRVGVISRVQDLASTTRDATDFVETVFGSPQRRMALRMSFGTPEEFARFERFVQFQRDKVRTNRNVMGGSQTAERQATLADGEVDPAVILNLGTGNLTGAATAAGRQALSRLSGMNERSASAMSRMLFETDPAIQAQIMRRLVERGEMDAATAQRLLRRPELYTGQLGATAGLLSDD